MVSLVRVSVLGCTYLIFAQPGAKVNERARCFAQPASASRHQAQEWRLLHIPAGQRPCTSSTSDHWSAVTRDTWLHIPSAVATEQARSITQLTIGSGVCWRSVCIVAYSYSRCRSSDVSPNWRVFDQQIIDRAIKQWRSRLRSCVANKLDTLSSSCDLISFATRAWPCVRECYGLMLDKLPIVETVFYECSV